MHLTEIEPALGRLRAGDGVRLAGDRPVHYSPETSLSFGAASAAGVRRAASRWPGSLDPARRVGSQERLGGIDAHRSREQVPLAQRAAEADEPFGLVGLLDALGNDLEPERPPEIDDRPGDRGPLAGRRDAGDERAVDLQDVDREALEVAQRRVAGPEVVDREMDAERAQLGRAARWCRPSAA